MFSVLRSQCRKIVSPSAQALQSSWAAIQPTLYPLKHSFKAVTDEKFRQVGREGLPQIIDRATDYIESDEICDREALKNYVSAHFGRKGGLVLMLGGKTTGKSHLLRNTVKKHNEGKGTPPENNTKGKVLYVDLRTSTQLGLVAAAVEAALKQKLVMVKKSDKDNLIGQVLGATSGMICAVTSNMPTVLVPVAGVVSDIAKRAARDETIASLEEIVKAGVSTIVFDEANLTMDAAALKEDEIKQSKKEFEHIVSVTKVTRNLSAILVSSEHAWLFKLQAAGFKTENFNDLIVAGEVHSDAMGRLLRQWGVGDELQTLLLATYGGHIDLTFRALCELNRLGDAFRADGITTLLGLSDCLDDKENTMKHLKAIANDGFSPVVSPNHDVCAKVISESGVGGVVSRNAKGLWSEATVHNHVLIASSHHMRYLIWRELQKLQ